MAFDLRAVFIAGLTIGALACSPDDNNGAPAFGPLPDSGTSIAAPVTADTGTTPPINTANDAGAMSDAGSQLGTNLDSGSTPPLDSAAAIDTGVLSADSGANEAGAGEGGSSAGSTSLSGTYGSLGAVKPIVNAYWISTGLESIIYLSSTPLTCAQVMTEGGRWLLMLPSEGQVLELVMKGGTAKMGTFKIPGAEANYAQGGKSSATEKGATSGTLTITKVEAMTALEGTIMATYSSGSVMGSFHAEWCASGQEW